MGFLEQPILKLLGCDNFPSPIMVKGDHRHRIGKVSVDKNPQLSPQRKRLPACKWKKQPSSGQDDLFLPELQRLAAKQTNSAEWKRSCGRKILTMPCFTPPNFSVSILGEILPFLYYNFSLRFVYLKATRQVNITCFAEPSCYFYSFYYWFYFAWHTEA